MVYGGVSFNTNAQKIQADLAEVGINVTLQPGEIQVALENATAAASMASGIGSGVRTSLIRWTSSALCPPGKVATERNNWQLDEVCRRTFRI